MTLSTNHYENETPVEPTPEQPVAKPEPGQPEVPVKK